MTLFYGESNCLLGVLFTLHTTDLYIPTKRSNELYKPDVLQSLDFHPIDVRPQKETVGAQVQIGAVKQKIDGDSGGREGGGLSALQCRINGVDSKV